VAYDNSGYQASRRAIQQDYDAKTIAGDYGRSQGQQRHTRNQGAMTKKFKSGWGKNAAGWGAKGHTGSGIKSGFYQQAMTDYASGYQQDRTRAIQDYQDEQNQFGIQQQRFEAERQNALAELEARKRMEIAMLAENIQAIGPGMGR
jgi:hypothetical protein